MSKVNITIPSMSVPELAFACRRVRSCRDVQCETCPYELDLGDVPSLALNTILKWSGEHDSRSVKVSV